MFFQINIIFCYLDELSNLVFCKKKKKKDKKNITELSPADLAKSVVKV